MARFSLLTFAFLIGASEWTSSSEFEACVDASAAHLATCDGSATLPDHLLISASMNYSAFPHTVTTRFVDQNGETLVELKINPYSFNYLLVAEIRLECYATVPELGTAKVCTAVDIWKSRVFGGPYFFNLTGSGIQPGWTCEMVGCFVDDDDGEVTYYRLPSESYTIPEDPTSKSTTTASASTSVPTTYKSTHTTLPTTSTTWSERSTSLEATIYDDRNETTSATSIAFHFDDHVYVYIITVTLTVALFLVILLHVLGVVMWRRQTRLRKKMLLMYNKDNMVFDPDFYPAVAIEKPASFCTQRRSLDLLQSLNPVHQTNIYVSENGHTSEEPFDRRGSCQMNITGSTFTDLETGLANDTTSLNTVVLSDHDYVSSSDRPTVGVYNITEGGYLSKANVDVDSLDSPTAAVESVVWEGLPEDNESCLTEAMSLDNHNGNCATDLIVKCDDRSPSPSQYVHTCWNAFAVSAATGQQSHYVSSNEGAVSAKADLSDQYSQSLDPGDCSDKLDLYSLHSMASLVLEGNEASRCNNSCTAKVFPDANSDLIRLDNPYLKDTKAFNSSYVFLRPPLVMSSEQDSASETHDYPATEHLNYIDDSLGSTTSHVLPPSSSYSAASGREGARQVVLDSQSAASRGNSRDTRKYIPSEELTRRILVPPGEAASPMDVATGFTVHLDFD